MNIEDIGWNAWPDLPFVEGRVVPVSDHFSVGASIQKYTQPNGSNIPWQTRSEIAKLLAETEYRGMSPNDAYGPGFPGHVRWTKPRPLGQLSVDPNVVCVIEFNGKHWSDPPIIIEVILGCEHNFESVKAGNCFHKGHCTKCEARYEVDSSG